MKKSAFGRLWGGELEVVGLSGGLPDPTTATGWHTHADHPLFLAEWPEWIAAGFRARDVLTWRSLAARTDGALVRDLTARCRTWKRSKTAPKA
jgi:hypothetical protein